MQIVLTKVIALFNTYYDDGDLKETQISSGKSHSLLLPFNLSFYI